MDELSQLKRLLFEDEQNSIERLQERVERPHTRAQDVAEVLAESFHLNQGEHTDLVDAMRAPVNRCISDSVRSDPQGFADALFPVMGPAIRKAVAESIAALAERINETLEKSFSARGIQWRIESWRTGVPVSEIILRETLLYRLEQAFVIQRETGLLVAHAARPEIRAAQDSDAISAMLTAIQEFVRDSFASGEHSDLDRISVGGRTVWIFYGPEAMIAGVIRGNPPSQLADVFHAVNEKVHARFAGALAEFKGDRATITGIEPMLQPLLEAESMRNNGGRARTSKAPLLVLLALIAVAVLAYLFVEYRYDRNRARLLDSLNAIPGIEVLGADTADPITVRMLQDPLAEITDAAVESAGFDRDDVVLEVTPFQSLEPQIIKRRFTRLLQPPAGVALDLDDQRLVISGRASQQWRDRVMSIPVGMGGIDAIDLSALMVGPAEAELIAAARRQLEPPDTVDFRIDGDQLVVSGTARYSWIRRARATELALDTITTADFANVEPLAGSMEQYFRELTGAPDGVTFDYDDGGLSARGVAPQRWITRFAATTPEPPHVLRIDASGLVIAERQRLSTLLARINETAIYFSEGTALRDDSAAALAALRDTLREVAELDRQLDSARVVFTVIGFADNTGGDALNRKMRAARANTLADIARRAGISPASLTVVAENTQEEGEDPDWRRAEIRAELLDLESTRGADG